ncbi:MAG: sulfatase-like hydrolase/transferase [Actinomycetota bacterium]|nr:sulfatase-like hydrolase/transferase [Actinomycetota bacterium]
MRWRNTTGTVLCALILALLPGTARAASPTITKVWPRRGPVGKTVFISGSGLTGTTAVSFNGQAASFHVRSDARIQAIVPSGATTGPIEVTADGVASSPNPFIVQPNIVLILTDDQRFDQVDHMPTVQSELIEKGVQFTNGFVVNPLCCPSRTTILTGKYSHGTDVYSNIPPHGGFQTFVTSLHEDRHTVATWLQGAGYHTGLVGKYLNGYSVKKASYVSPGWDVWDALTLNGSNGGEGTGGYYDYNMSIGGVPAYYGTAESDYSTDVLSNYATDFIQNAPTDQPLFLYFAPRAPHGPATPPARYADALANVPPLRTPSYNEEDVSDKPAYIQAIPPWSDSLKASEDALYLRQYRSLLAVDDAVGNILQSLRNTGRLKDTLIVFASDNGLNFGEHRWLGKKVPYEESIRVPIIARYDALTPRAPVTDPRFVLNLDFAPTFAAAGGVSAPGSEGVSFLPLLDDSATQWRSDFLIEHLDPKVVKVPAYCAVRDERYIYVEYSTTDPLGNREQELYDLQNDPYELSNLLITDPANPQVIATRAAMYNRMVQLCSPPPPGFTP